MSLIGNVDTPESYVADYMQACVGMFGIPAGGFTSDIETFGSATSYDVESLYAAMLNSTIGRSIYAPGISNESFATKLVDKVGGGLLSDANKAAAIDEVQALLDGGLSRAATAMAVVEFVAGLETSDETYGAVAQQFQNRIEIANYYTFSTTNPSSTLATLTSVLSSVDNETDVSDPAAVLEENPDTGVSTGQTITLTTNAETVSSSSADTIIGVIATSGSTFQTGDTINAAKEVNITGANTVANTVDVNNVGTFNLTDLAGVTVTSTLFTNVANFNTIGTTGVTTTVANGELATVYGVKDSTNSLSIGIRTSDTSGTADAINVSANNAGTKTGSVGAGYTTTSATITTPTLVEAVKLATTGTNYVTISASTTATTDSKTLTVTGDGINTITASSMTQATLFDMSGSTGTNTLSLGNALATGTTVKGGSGSDTLSLATSGTVANVTVTGVETLSLGTGSNTGTLVFASAPGFTKVSVGGDTSESGTYTLTSLGNTVTDIAYAGDGLTANSGSGQQFNSLTINNSFTGTDTVNVAIGNKGTTQGASVNNTMNTMTLNGVETLKIAVSDAAVTGTTTFTGITDNALQSLTVTSAGNVVLGTVNGAPSSGGGSLALLDLTGVTGTSASTLTLANNTITAGTVINAATGGTTLTIGGAEASTDSIVYTGAAGVDSIDAGTNSFAGVVVADGKGGNDIIVGGISGDSLTGGEGADTITGGRGNDTIVLTETVNVDDTVIFGGAALTSAGGNMDTITGFTSADTMQFGSTFLGANTYTSTNLTTIAASTVNGMSANDGDILLVSDNLTGASGSAAIATLVGGTSGFSVAGTQDVVIVADDGSNAYVWYVNDSFDGDATTVGTGDIVLIGTLTGTDVSAFAAGNFAATIAA